MQIVDSTSATCALFSTPGATLIVRDLSTSELPSLSGTTNIYVTGGAASTTSTSGDAEFTTQLYPTVTKTETLNPTIALYHPWGMPTIALSDKTPGGAGTVVNLSDGVCSYVAPGTAKILADFAFPSGTTLRCAYSFTADSSWSSTPASAPVFTQYISTSVAYEMIQTFATLLTAAGSPNPNGNTNLYSSFDYSSGTYVRNTSHWAYGYDLTCIPAANSHWGSGKECGVLVTPQHLLQANHVALPVGTTMVFVGNDNSVQTATIASQSGLLSGTTDICVATLSAPLTSAITPATILPSSYATHLPNPQYGYPLAAVEWEQHAASNLYVYDTISSTYFGYNGTTTCFDMGQSADATRSLWWQSFISGDSGGGIFMLIGGKAVLVSQLYSGGGIEPMDAAYISTINAALSNGYSVTPADLSSYTP